MIMDNVKENNPSVATEQDLHELLRVRYEKLDEMKDQGRIPLRSPSTIRPITAPISRSSLMSWRARPSASRDA